MPDVFEILILPDGTIKITTDRIGEANHLAAEKMLTDIAALSGGDTTIERRAERPTQGKQARKATR